MGGLVGATIVSISNADRHGCFLFDCMLFRYSRPNNNDNHK